MEVSLVKQVRHSPRVCPSTVRPSSPRQALRASKGFVNWTKA